MGLALAFPFFENRLLLTRLDHELFRQSQPPVGPQHGDGSNVAMRLIISSDVFFPGKKRKVRNRRGERFRWKTRTFSPKCSRRFFLWDPQRRTTKKAKLKHGKDLCFPTRLYESLRARVRLGTISHCIVFREVLKIACLHSKQVINLSDYFSPCERTDPACDHTFIGRMFMDMVDSRKLEATGV